MQTAKLLPFFALLCLNLGCGGYKMGEIYSSLEAGNPEAALDYLDEKAPDKENLPFLFERGLVAHYADRYQESNTALSRAESISENLYTRSISKEAAALLTTDLVRPYPGARYERLLSHYYRILNYLYLNEIEDALVECRRATRLIRYYVNEDEDYDFFGAPFLAYLSGILFESSGELNDAFISYQQAEEYYERASSKTGVSFPENLGVSLVRLARQLGFSEEEALYRRRFGDPHERTKGYGELILFYESGYVPSKYEETLTFPILKSDLSEDDTKKGRKKRKNSEFARTLVSRRGKSYSKSKLEYLLHVAMPAIRSNRPRLTGIAVGAGNVEQRGILVADVETMAIETLKSQEGGILLRTVARALLKYLAYREVTKKSEDESESEEEADRTKEIFMDLLGRAVNVVNIATEHADTRSWQTLPNQIFLVRMRLPAGKHNITLSFSDRTNRRVKTDTLKNVVIRKNDKTFLNYRTFE
jgi:hypothetical protein